MQAWCGLDRQTYCAYSWYENAYFGNGWIVSLQAPGQVFGGYKLHRREEDAANHVKSLYEQYVQLQEKKASAGADR